MRIIGGEYRGRKILGAPSGATRPTKDRIREAVFNVIAECVPGSDVLDLFSGTGAYGIEALSRGARSVVLVEKNERAAGVIRRNLASFSLENKARVIVKDAFKAIELLSTEKARFSLIFSDPPYNEGLAKKTLNMINHYDILAPTGFAVIEHHKAEVVPENEGKISILKQKTYGDTFISIFHKNG